MHAPSRVGGPGWLPRIAAAAACVFGGCAIEVPVGENPVEREKVAELRPDHRSALDVLFVVDDRASMGSVRDESVLLWRRLREHLAYADGGFPDVHVGVVSSDVGVGNAKIAGCTPNGGGGALVGGWLDIDGDNQLVSDPQVAARLALPDAGCAFDQPVLAMERALDGEVAGNDGFRRDDAALAIVFVSGEDDCSVDDPAFWAPDVNGHPADAFRCFREAVYCPGDDVMLGERDGCVARTTPAHLIAPEQVHGFLDRIAPKETRFVTAIVGDGSGLIDIVDGGNGPAIAPVCNAATRTLFPGVRLHDLANGDSGVAIDACGASVESAGLPAGLGVRGALGNACLGGDLYDTLPDQAGIQPDCVVDAIVDGRTHAMPECENAKFPYGQAGPCWAIEQDPDACGDYASRVSVLVNWGGAQPMVQPADTIARVSCVLASKPQ